MAVNLSSPPKSKSDLAKQLGIARSSLYYKPKMPAKDLAFKIEIEKAMAGKNKAYGHKRIAIALNANKKRVLRVMKLFNLKPQRKRKAPFKPEDLNQVSMNIPNLIKEVIVKAPNKVWVKDFTYLPFFGRFVYLATIEDFFTREVIGWTVSLKHDTDLVTQAMLSALQDNQAPEIAHSDQGSEYRAKEYVNFLKSLEIQPSMSQKASPWQNGKPESFYSNFKLELGHPECYPTLGELIEAIAGQIHYYNHERIHTALKCPPSVFAQRIKAQKSISNDGFYKFIKQKNQQLSWCNQEITKVLCV